MNFEEFWASLQFELRRERVFRTLKQRKRFTAYFNQYINGDLYVLVLTPYGKKRGTIPRNEFEGLWDRAKEYPPETRFVNKNGRLTSYIRQDGEEGKHFSLSYIVALMYHIVRDQRMD